MPTFSLGINMGLEYIQFSWLLNYKKTFVQCSYQKPICLKYFRQNIIFVFDVIILCDYLKDMN